MIKLIIITITQLLFFSCSKHIIKPQIEETNAKARTAFFEIHDISILPGEEANIEIQLYNNNYLFPYLNPIYGENVEIYQNQKLITKTNNSSTSKNKNVMLPLLPQDDLQVYQVSLEPSSNYAATGEFIINVMNKCHPAIIVDIDHTIANISSLEFIVKKYNKVPTFDQAVEKLKLLSLNYRIIYLTARNDMLMQATRDWLNFLNFPKGPIYFWNYSKHPFSVEFYKKNILKTLSQKFKNIIAGIGDQETDILAYQSIGLRSYAFRNNSINLQNVIHVNSWDDFYSDLNNYVKDPQTLCSSP